LRGLSAIAWINLLVLSVVIGGYVLVEPLRPSPGREFRLAQEAFFGLLLASAIAVAVTFLALLFSTTPRGRWRLLLSLVSGLAVAVALILVANVVAAAVVYESMATVGPMLTAVVPIGLALAAIVLSAMSSDRKRATERLAFGMGVGLGLILFLLNVTNSQMNVLYAH